MRDMPSPACPPKHTREGGWLVLANKQTEERPGEERGVDVTILQRERLAQAVAVGEKNQREAARRHLEDQRRIGAGRVAELPVEGFAIVGLHEPPEARWHP